MAPIDTDPTTGLPRLAILADPASVDYTAPIKQIHEGPDVARFLTSTAYRDIGLFVMQLNHALVPRTAAAPGTLPTAANTTVYTLADADAAGYAPPIVQLRALLSRIGALVDEAPPDPGPRRFGNASFRTWHGLLESRVDALLDEFCVVREPRALVEIKAYLLGAFGSAQRLDFGTGHELNFLAFLGCLWKLGFFVTESDASSDESAGAVEGAVERSIVLGVLEPYLAVVRTLILTYTLEPAGSHGVWGLDDHFFLPYIFGSAQLARPLRAFADATPLEGSAPRVAKPADVAKPATVAVERTLNLYFSAIGFVNDVKTGPFWEHSPILYDVAGIKDGWGKINKGMIKMFNAEVLSKFPVVQHFYFGALFSWDPDPDAPPPENSVHMASQPVATAATQAVLGPKSETPTPTPTPMPSTAAPWAQATRMPGRAGGLPGPGIPYSRVGMPMPPTSSTRAPFAPPGPAGPNAGSSSGGSDAPVTRAPWAR